MLAPLPPTGFQPMKDLPYRVEVAADCRQEHFTDALWNSRRSFAHLRYLQFISPSASHTHGLPTITCPCISRELVANQGPTGSVVSTPLSTQRQLRPTFKC